MSTPEQLASLEGQQYLVLRPTSVVADRYRAEQRTALARADVPHPHTGHVTLRGFFEPERREELTVLLRRWAATQPPIEVVAEAVDAFPTPWQIIIIRLSRTPTLVSAYARLTEELDRTDFRRLGELPLEEWTFHLSVAYAKTLEPAAWTTLSHMSRRSIGGRPSETIGEAELVWYEGGVEHSEVLAFTG